MTDRTAFDDRWWHRRFGLKALLGSIVLCALGLGALKWHQSSHAVWDQFGGMTGWNQGAIEARLGPPRESIEGDLPDQRAGKIRIRTPGVYRTCTYQGVAGQFIVWYRQVKPGGFDCIGSKWVEKDRYY